MGAARAGGSGEGWSAKMGGGSAFGGCTRGRWALPAPAAAARAGALRWAAAAHLVAAPVGVVALARVREQCIVISSGWRYQRQRNHYKSCV